MARAGFGVLLLALLARSGAGQERTNKEDLDTRGHFMHVTVLQAVPTKMLTRLPTSQGACANFFGIREAAKAYVNCPQMPQASSHFASPGVDSCCSNWAGSIWSKSHAW